MGLAIKAQTVVLAMLILLGSSTRVLAEKSGVDEYRKGSAFAAERAIIESKRQSDKMAADLLRRMDQLNEQYRQIQAQMQAIDQNRRDLEIMLMKIDDLDSIRGGMVSSSSEPETVGQEQQRELEAQQDKIPDLPRISADVGGGVLTPKGQLVLEPSVSFTNNSVNRVSIEGYSVANALVIGPIDVRSVQRETFITALSARYGITDRLEAEFKASWVSRNDDTVTRSATEPSAADEVFSAKGDGAGDMEFALRYQFAKHKNWPFLVANLRFKSDSGEDPFEFQTRDLVAGGVPNFAGRLGTGSGFWSVSPSLTFIYPTDPVAIFGSIGYLWTLEDDKGIFAVEVPDAGTGMFRTEMRGFGNVDPGDAWRLSFGMGIGLNESSSISFSYALDLYDETIIENARPQRVVGSDVTIGKFVVGYSFRTPGGTPWNIAFGMGTTDAAPDTDITVRLPFRLFD